MSGKSNPKGVVNTYRRTWDKEEYREKAEEREEKVGGRVLRREAIAAPPGVGKRKRPLHQSLPPCCPGIPPLLLQEKKADDDALELKKRKRLERDPLHQVGGRWAPAPAGRWRRPAQRAGPPQGPWDPVRCLLPSASGGTHARLLVAVPAVRASGRRRASPPPLLVTSPPAAACLSCAGPDCGARQPEGS